MDNTTKVSLTIDVDFRALCAQKDTLIRAMEGHVMDQEDKDHLDGILHFIDAFQDESADSLGEEVIFGCDEVEEKK